MKKFILILSLLISFNSISQKYISFSPALFTNAGGFKKSFCPTIEFGKRWDVYRLGLGLGKTNLTNQSIDTTVFLEARNTLSVYQQGKFSNNLIIGAGYLFNSNTNFISELTTSIEYSPNNKWSYNVYIGTYYFKGTDYGYSNNFFGTSVIYYIK